MFSILILELQRAQSSWPSFHAIQNLVNPGSMNNHVTDNNLMYNNLSQNLIPSPKQTPLLSAMNGDNMSPLFPQMFSSETRYPSSSQYPYRANATSSPASTANVTSPSLGLFSANSGLDANQNVVNGGLTHMTNNMNMMNNQVTSSMVNSTNGLFTTTTALSDQDLLNHVTSTTPKGMYQNSSQTSANALSLSHSTVYSNIGSTYPLLRPASSLMNSPLGLNDVGNVKLQSGNGVTYTDLTNSTTNINGYAYSPKDDHSDLSKVSDVMNQIDDLSHARIKLETEAAVRSTSPKVWRPY